MRPIYKIIIIAVILVLLAFAAWFVWKNFISKPLPTISPPPVNLPITPGSGIRGAENEEPITQGSYVLQKLSDEPVFDFWVDSRTNEVYYLTKTGAVFAAHAGPDTKISSQELPALNGLQKESRGGKILAAFGNPEEPQWGIFDVIDKAWRPLPSEILKAAWGEKDTELITLLKTNGNVRLATADISKTPIAYKTLLQDLRLNDADFFLATSTKLFFSEKPSANYTGRIWQLDLKTLAFSLIISGEQGSMLRSSTDKRIFFKYSSPDNFFILDPSLEELTPTAFETLPSKCDNAFQEQTIYCFVPQVFKPIDIPGVILPDDYLKNKFYTIDDLYAMKIQSGETVRLFQSNRDLFPALDAKNVTHANGKLYFVSRYDDALYELLLATPEELTKQN